MSKAKERANECYPDDDVASIQSRFGFLLGYQQAEKDLELGWKDMAEIVKTANLLEIEWLNGTPWDGTRDCGFYQEVLKRFKEKKGERHKDENIGI